MFPPSSNSPAAVARADAWRWLGDLRRARISRGTV